MSSGEKALQKSQELAKTYPNVDPFDFIRTKNNRLKYKAFCLNCNEDKGYKLLKDLAKHPYCWKCSPGGKYKRKPEQIEAFIERMQKLPKRGGLIRLKLGKPYLKNKQPTAKNMEISLLPEVLKENINKSLFLKCRRQILEKSLNGKVEFFNTQENKEYLKLEVRGSFFTLTI
jgi:hypothetical protein